MRMNRHLAAAGLSCTLALALAGAAQAQDEAPLCTDRPTKANATCTVPAGRWQIESDAFNITRNTGGGVRQTTTILANPYLKYGLTGGVDLQANWSPRVVARTTDRATGLSSRTTGVSDLILRAKVRAYAGDTASVSLIPFVKAPTASRGLGNDRWEGGVAAPMSFSLADSWTLTLGPEVDLLADADGRGRHAALINLVNIARPVTGRLTLAGEVWSSLNFDPAGTVRQYSADVAAVYLLSPRVQLDVGANFGLNRKTPDAQVYAGVSTRF